jgi:hypothetical protein
VSVYLYELQANGSFLMWVRDSGSWKEVKQLWVRDGGEWKEAKQLWARVSGEWK